MSPSPRFVIAPCMLSAALLSSAVPALAQPPSDEDVLDAELGVAGGLRVDDVVRATVETSHDVRAREAELAAARAEVDRATLAFVPRLGLSASYFRLSEIDAPTLGYVAAPADQTTPGPIAPGSTLVAVPLSFPVLLDQTQVRAQLAIPVSDYFLRVMPSRDAAEHAVRAGESTIAATSARLALDAETLYWSWARAQLARIVAQQALARAEAHRDDAQRLRNAGLGVEADVARAEAQVAAMRELVDTTDHLRAAIADRMRTVMHASAISEEIGETLPELGDGPPALEPTVSLALSSRSELRAVDAQIAALEAQRTIQDAAYAPRVDVVAEALVANPNPRFVPAQERFEATWAVGAQVSWQLSDALAADPSRRGLESRIAAARSSRELLAEGIRAEVVDAHRQLADAESAIASRLAQVEAAERTLRQASEIFRAGRGTGLPVVDAQTLLVRARLDLLQARIDLALAAARMRRATEE